MTTSNDPQQDEEATDEFWPSELDPFWIAFLVMLPVFLLFTCRPRTEDPYFFTNLTLIAVLVNFFYSAALPAIFNICERALNTVLKAVAYTVEKIPSVLLFAYNNFIAAISNVSRIPRSFARFSNTAIESPPGSRLARIFKFVFTSKTYSRVFEPIFSDWQIEYVEAIATGEKLKARWVWVRGYIILSVALSTWVMQSSLGKVISAFNKD